MNELSVPKRFQDMIFLQGQNTRTNSLLVAERFGKRHADVLRAIDDTECSDAFRKQNFMESMYIDEQGQSRKLYNLTWKGFSKLAFGFNGKAAADWQEKFLDAFEWMQNELTRLQYEIGLDKGMREGISQTRLEARRLIDTELSNTGSEISKYKHRWEQEKGRKEKVEKENKSLASHNRYLERENAKVKTENANLKKENAVLLSKLNPPSTGIADLL